MCKGKKNQKDFLLKLQLIVKYVQEEEQEELFDLDFIFQVRVDKFCFCNCVIVEV